MKRKEMGRKGNLLSPPPLLLSFCFAVAPTLAQYITRLETLPTPAKKAQDGGDGEKRKPLIPSPSLSPHPSFFHFVLLSLQLWRNI